MAYAGVLALFVVAGALLRLTSLHAAGVTFAFLFAGEKGVELAAARPAATWPLALCGSLALWRAGLLLSSSPGWAAALVDLR